MKKTYDIQFNDSENSNNKGFNESLTFCKDYIKSNNGTNHSYFADYKGGTVSVVCNQTGQEIYSEKSNMKYYTLYLDESIVDQIREKAEKEAIANGENPKKALSRKVRQILRQSVKNVK